MSSTKQILSITDAAASRIKELYAKRNKPSFGIRIGVKTGGCNGLKYKFEYADEAKPLEQVISDKDITIVIEPNAVMYLIGTTLDYVDKEVKSGFVFVNPNVKAECGCGESFTT